MKKISYRNTFELFLPNHWGVFDVNGEARAFENGDNDSVFECYFVSPKELKKKSFLNVVSLLNALPFGDKEITCLDNNVYLRKYIDRFSRGRRKLISYYWFVANESSLKTKKAISFSYTTLVKNMESYEHKEIVEMLDKQVRLVKFVSAEMPDNGDITVTLEHSGQTLIVGQVEGIYY